MSNETLRKLSAHPAKAELLGHPLFRELEERDLKRPQVEVLLAQWYRPLSFFPAFLGRLIANLESVEGQTYVSRILWEELGEGNPKNAHVRLFESTMATAGFSTKRIQWGEELHDTTLLVERYNEASSGCPFEGIGSLCATELVDLMLVATIGKAVTKVSGLNELPWVDIHLKQEPGHVESSDSLLEFMEFDDDELVLQAAERMWNAWSRFFDNIRKKIWQQT